MPSFPNNFLIAFSSLQKSTCQCFGGVPGAVDTNCLEFPRISGESRGAVAACLLFPFTFFSRSEFRLPQDCAPYWISQRRKSGKNKRQGKSGGQQEFYTETRAAIDGKTGCSWRSQSARSLSCCSRYPLLLLPVRPCTTTTAALQSKTHRHGSGDYGPGSPFNFASPAIVFGPFQVSYQKSAVVSFKAKEYFDTFTAGLICDT